MYNCWWCGKIGDSGEHKFKRTDIISEFGDSFRQKKDHPVFVKDNQTYELKSPNSKFMKFEKVLCSDCNNHRSQKFDKAYDELVAYIFANFEKLKYAGFINFSEVFGYNWKTNKRHVYSYFIKHFCCRLAINGIKINNSLIEFLDETKDFLEFININLVLKADLKAYLDKMTEHGEHTGFLQFGKLTYHGEESNPSLVYSFLSKRWFKAEFFYSSEFNCSNYKDLKEFFNSPYSEITTLSLIGYDNLENLSLEEHDMKFEEYKLKKENESLTSHFEEYVHTNPYSV